MKRSHKRAANVSFEDMPKCAACQFGKQTNQSKPGSVRASTREREGVLSADKPPPGERVFVDHFACATKGRIFSGKGKCNYSPETNAPKDVENGHCGGCTFADAGTGHIAMEFQHAFNKEDTTKALDSHEKKAQDKGVIVKECQFDNGGAFTSKELRAALSQKSQACRCSGPGSHHQNGRAERGIRTAMSMARTMLMHQATHWSQQLETPTETSGWPMSVKPAAHICNHVPKPTTGLTAHELWTRTKEHLKKPHNIHVFGCPAYVLQKDIADGKKLPRWSD